MLFVISAAIAVALTVFLSGVRFVRLIKVTARTDPRDTSANDN